MKFKKMDQGSKQNNQNETKGTKGAFKLFCLCLVVICLLTLPLLAQELNSEHESSDGLNGENGMEEYGGAGKGITCEIQRTEIELLAYSVQNFNLCEEFVNSFNLGLNVDRHGQLIQLISDGQPGDLFLSYPPRGNLSLQAFMDARSDKTKARLNEVKELISAVVKAEERAVEYWNKLNKRFLNEVLEIDGGEVKCFNIRQYKRSFISIALDEEVVDEEGGDLVQAYPDNYGFVEEGETPKIDVYDMLRHINGRRRQAEIRLESITSLRDQYSDSAE